MKKELEDCLTFSVLVAAKNTRACIAKDEANRTFLVLIHILSKIIIYNFKFAWKIFDTFDI